MSYLKMKTENWKSAHSFITNVVSNFPEGSLFDEDSVNEEDDEQGSSEIEKTLYLTDNKPQTYWQTLAENLQRRYSDIVDVENTSEDDNGAPSNMRNPLYLPLYRERLVKLRLPYCTLWSRILSRRLDRLDAKYALAKIPAVKCRNRMLMQ